MCLIFFFINQWYRCINQEWFLQIFNWFQLFSSEYCFAEVTGHCEIWYQMTLLKEGVDGFSYFHWFQLFYIQTRIIPDLWYHIWNVYRVKIIVPVSCQDLHLHRLLKLSYPCWGNSRFPQRGGLFPKVFKEFVIFLELTFPLTSIFVQVSIICNKSRKINVIHQSTIQMLSVIYTFQDKILL